MKDIAKYIDKMWNQGSDGNFLSLAVEPYFIQIIAPKKGRELYIDAVSNAHLPEKAFLSEEQISEIYKLGFEDAPRSGDFTIALPFGRDSANYEKAAEIVRKLMEIYGMNPKKVDVELVL